VVFIYHTGNSLKTDSYLSVRNNTTPQRFISCISEKEDKTETKILRSIEIKINRDPEKAHSIIYLTESFIT